MRKKYTKAEKQEIIKTLDVVLDNLEEIWNLNLINSIEVPVKFEGISDFEESNPKDGWYFCLDDKGVHVENVRNDVPGFFYSYRNEDGSLKRVYNVDEREVMLFKEYDYIRTEIMKKITQAQEEKQEDMAVVSNLRDKYQRNALVKITLPDTLNQHEIRISRQNGKTVGKIDFGPAVIELITTEGIKLVYEEQKDEAKIKQK